MLSRLTRLCTRGCEGCSGNPAKDRWPTPAGCAVQPRVDARADTAPVPLSRSRATKALQSAVPAGALLVRIDVMQWHAREDTFAVSSMTHNQPRSCKEFRAVT